MPASDGTTLEVGRVPPNELLAALVAEAGLSNTGLASRVRDAARRDKKKSSADHVSVSRWLAGGMPRPDTAVIISQVLSGKLGRPVSLSELGFQATPGDGQIDFAELGVKYPASSDTSVRLLAGISKADLAEEPAAQRLHWSSLASAGVITSFLFSAPLDSPEADNGGSVVAKRIRDTVAHLAELDFKVGGGNARKLVLFYFGSEVVPALDRRYLESERRAVLGAASEVAQLLGWTAYDSGRHGVAQRYFTQALRLAEEARDRLLGGAILANMSHQANYLGRHSDAVHLARAAQSAVLASPVATVSSMFLSMEARALAASGNSKESVRAIRRAEEKFEARDVESDPDWIGYFDRSELAGEAVHCFRDLGHIKEARAFGQEAYSADAPVRTQAFIGVVNASVALKDGQLDEAAGLISKTMDLAAPVESRRYLQYLRDFHDAVVDQHGLDPRGRALVDQLIDHYPSLIQATTD